MPHNDNAVQYESMGPVGTNTASLMVAERVKTLRIACRHYRDATRNAAAVSEVIKVHEHCSRPEIDRLPDLLVVCNRVVDLSAVDSDDTGC